MFNHFNPLEVSQLDLSTGIMCWPQTFCKSLHWLVTTYDVLLRLHRRTQQQRTNASRPQPFPRLWAKLHLGHKGPLIQDVPAGLPKSWDEADWSFWVLLRRTHLPHHHIPTIWSGHYWHLLQKWLHKSNSSPLQRKVGLVCSKEQEAGPTCYPSLCRARN